MTDYMGTQAFWRDYQAAGATMWQERRALKPADFSGLQFVDGEPVTVHVWNTHRIPARD